MKPRKEVDWLYVTWAIKHLLAIDKAIYDLSQFSNMSLNDMLLAMYRERRKFLQDASHAHAQEELEQMVRHGLIQRRGDLYIGFLGTQEGL